MQTVNSFWRVEPLRPPAVEIHYTVFSTLPQKIIDPHLRSECLPLIATHTSTVLKFLGIYKDRTKDILQHGACNFDSKAL